MFSINEKTMVHAKYLAGSVAKKPIQRTYSAISPRKVDTLRPQ